MPFAYQSTGIETRFTNGLDPDPRARPVFAFHKPETLADWLGSAPGQVQLQPPEYGVEGKTFLECMQHMPDLQEQGLWPTQITAVSVVYRLIKVVTGTHRILFLVDRGNLGDQTLKEFQQYVSPYNNFKFSEEYIVQRLSSNPLDAMARVCIGTILRMYSMLKGRKLRDQNQALPNLRAGYVPESQISLRFP